MTRTRRYVWIQTSDGDDECPNLVSLVASLSELTRQPFVEQMRALATERGRPLKLVRLSFEEGPMTVVPDGWELDPASLE